VSATSGNMLELTDERGVLENYKKDASTQQAVWRNWG